MNPNDALRENGYFTAIAAFMRQSGEELVKSLGVTKSMRILDVGCGDGTTALPLARLGAEVVGIDMAKNVVVTVGGEENELDCDLNAASARVTYGATPLQRAIDNRHAGVFVIHGAAQAAPQATRFVGGNGSTNPLTTTIDPVLPGTPAVDVLTRGNVAAFTPSASGQVERWEQSCTSSGSATSSRSATANDTLAFTWSHTDPNRYSHSLAAFRPAN
jgi:SAM-dependent methyltransferase